MTRLTESSPTVTPYSASAASIVPRLWVMTMNWVWWARLRSASANRPMFASSSAASTSSRTQNGTGRTSSIANSSATAVSARSPPDSIASACAFLPGGRATISIPVAPRSDGSVSDSRAKPPPKSCSKRVAKAASSAWNVVRKRSAMSVSSSAMSSRVRTIAVRRSDACVSSVSSRALSAPYSSTAYGLTAPSSWNRRRSCPSRDGLGGGPAGAVDGPDGRHEREGRLERDGFVGQDVVAGVGGVHPVGGGVAGRVGRIVGDDGSVPRPRRPASRTTASVAEPGQLDDDALVETLEPEPRLESDVVRGAQPGVRGAQAFAGGGRVALGRAEPVPVGGVGGVDLLEGRPCGCLGGLARRDLGAQGVALLGQRPLALAERRDVAVRSGHPLLGDVGRRLGTGSTILGVAAGRLAGRRFGGESIASPAELGGTRLPCRQGRPVGDIGARVACHGPSIRRPGPIVRSERGEGGTGAFELGGRSFGLGFVPRRLADDGLEPARRQALGLLGGPARTGRAALVGTGGLHRVRGGLGLGREADGLSRGASRPRRRGHRRRRSAWLPPPGARASNRRRRA